MAAPTRAWPAATGVAGALAYLLVGWCGLVVPSLVRSIEASHQVSDAEFGVYYLAFGLAYAAGAFLGGLATERAGRRPVLGLAAVLLASGLVAVALAPAWWACVLAAVPAGLGCGALDGGANGLFLDVYRDARGRALNLLHLFFSLGALAAPLVIGPLVDAGLPWQAVPVSTGLAVLGLGAVLLVVDMPTGRRAGVGAAGASGPAARGPGASRMPRVLVLLCLAIACYIASEAGVSDWLVRFLEPAPLSVATTALALFWAGMAVGRLGSARLADHFDHVAYAASAALLMAAGLTGAVLASSTPLSVCLFALAGLAAGPVAPMIMAVGGDRYPDRPAATGGYLTTAAVAGTIGFPTLMGLLSVTAGLSVAMLCAAALALVSAGALGLVGRNRERVPAPAVA
jgi:fucose permease